ncbi:MAG: DegV family protein [Woeseiaceae bacterium]
MAATISTHLDGDDLSQALISGIHCVIADQTFLNKINVFPVADGDTGTNLSLSLGAALGVLKQPGEKHLGTLLAATADALLDGARGNSGAIMAQFFQGVSDATGELTRFTTATFGKAIRSGSDYAHDAMSNPEEGTILSAIAAFATAIEKQVNNSQQSDFAAAFDEALPKLEQALADTTSQLDVLRKAGVVDAGAKGFVDLVKGMSDFVLRGEICPEPDLSKLISTDDMMMPVESGEDYEYRYCTECIVAATDIDRRKLRESLSRLGSSLVLAGSKRKAKIHIHVNDPQAVFDVGRTFGDVSGEKADDLHRQQHSGHQEVRNFAVITDSAADIADSDLDRLNIHMVPCRIQFGERGYLDKVSISSAEFYDELATNPHHPTTSQPAPGDFRRQFQYLANHFPDVISINLTSEASGTYEAAKSAASRTAANGKVHVINSLNASLGQGLLAVFAAECGRAGLSAKATVAAVEAQIPRTTSYGVLRNLDYAVRGGRIPRWVKILANSMRMTPVIRTSGDGKIVLSTCLFGKRNIAVRFARHVAKQIQNDGPTVIGIGHAVCPEKMTVIESVLGKELSNIKRLSKAELGTALGVHGGPGTLVIATQPYVNPADLAE